MVLSAPVNRSRNIDAGKRLRLKTINREAGSVFTVIQLGAQGFCAALWIGAAAELNRFKSSGLTRDAMAVAGRRVAGHGAEVGHGLVGRPVAHRRPAARGPARRPPAG